jgi:hypothetical protein
VFIFLFGVVFLSQAELKGESAQSPSRRRASVAGGRGSDSLRPKAEAASKPATHNGEKVRRFLATAMLLGCLSTQAKSDGFSGLDLLHRCTSKTAHLRDLCNIWILGFAAGVSSAQEAASLEPRICLPDGFTGAQAAIIIKKFMSEYPRLLHHDANLVAIVALANAFPCREDKAD